MPHFFFHLTDGKRTFTDANGVELRNSEAARAYLISHIRELRGTLSDNGIHDWSDWSVILSDVQNNTLQEKGFGSQSKERVMTNERKNSNNRVAPSYEGKFHAFWHGRVVFENGRVKRFETESEAWEFLARCDLAGKIIH